MPAVRELLGKSLFLIGVFLICMCGLMLQIVQTRVLSVILWYHLAFFAISLAMLGMTIGALLVHFKAALFPGSRLLENLVWISAAFSIAVVLSTFSLITTVIPAGMANTLVMTALAWLKLILILLPPYIFGGMAISLALTRSRWPVGLVYGVDLLGASTGCLLVLLLLNWADAISVLIAIGTFGAIAAVCFGIARRLAGETATPVLAIGRLGPFRRPAILAIVFGAVAIVNSAMQPNGLVLMLSKDKLEFTKPSALLWNSFSRIWVGEDTLGQPAMWGPSSIMPDFEVSERHLDIDGSAATAMYQFHGDVPQMAFLRYDITNLAYSIRHEGNAAVIGVGGGRDLLSAYVFGFRNITGVELNPIFVNLLNHSFRRYNNLVDLPGTRLFVDEARSWFARTTDRFDLIEMSLVDTWAATGVGAFSLSENGLYTVQGWRLFLNALTPTGVFTVSRWYNPQAVMETGRLISLAMAALRNEGVERPEAHLFLAATSHLATLIVSKSPFSADDVAILRARATALKFTVLISPDQPAASPVLQRVLDARQQSDFAALARDYHIDFSVTTDERPFFFNQLNLLDPQSIKIALHSDAGVVRGNLMASLTVGIIMALSGLLVLFAMIVPASPALRQAPARLALLGTSYFLLIGLGFMFVEIGLIQRISIFLGHPVYGLAIGLFGIILSTGIGSLVSGWWQLHTASRIIAWACTLGAYVALLPVWLPSVVLSYDGSSLFIRAFASFAAMTPAGLLMGWGFPTGMQLVNAVDTRPTPWFWAVNGAASVLAASVAVATSIVFSINVSLWFGAACYILLSPVGIGLMSLGQQVGTASRRLPIQERSQTPTSPASV